MKHPESSSSAEKRVLWEVRQRYHMDARVPPAARREGQLITPTRGRSSVSSRSRRSRQGSWLRRFTMLVVLGIVLSGGVFGYKILAASNKITSTDRSILGQLKDLLFVQGKVLAGESDDRINVMLLAIGGQGHNGQNLADTVMVASFRPSDNTVGLLSIPRDLYVQVPDEDYFTKINAVHAYGESKKVGKGPELLQIKVEEITGVPIHYYGRVDFTGFKQIVDAVGGVHITIENSFFDYWHKIAFSAGTETMDGERALAYVRARYIEGSEGGDFKRAARQQQILLALRDKIFSVNTAFDFGAINTILNSLSDNIRTDMELWEIKRFYEMARQINDGNVHSVVLTTGPRGALVGSTEVLGGTPAAILKTRTGDYSEIQELMRNIFAAEQDRAVAALSAEAIDPLPSPLESSPSPSPIVTPPTVEIRNGTNITGLAKETSTKLAAEGYTVTSIGNAANRTTTTTTVYAIRQTDTTGAQTIAEILEARADVDLPAGEAATTAQVVIILGEDAKID
ncbi:MAG: LCP family protein [Candidatus Andersenbacteria bacterium]